MKYFNTYLFFSQNFSLNKNTFCLNFADVMRDCFFITFEGKIIGNKLSLSLSLSNARAQMLLTRTNQEDNF